MSMGGEDPRVKSITPIHVATFTAARMESNADYDIIWVMVDKAGARVQGWTATRRKGRHVEVLRIIGKNRKTYDLAIGDWLIVLGNSGSIRVCTNNQYKHDYKETEA